MIIVTQGRWYKNMENDIRQCDYEETLGLKQFPEVYGIAHAVALKPFSFDI
jgi:hypothetical protein